MWCFRFLRRRCRLLPPYPRNSQLHCRFHCRDPLPLRRRQFLLLLLLLLPHCRHRIVPCFLTELN